MIITPMGILWCNVNEIVVCAGLRLVIIQVCKAQVFGQRRNLLAEAAEEVSF